MKLERYLIKGLWGKKADTSLVWSASCSSVFLPPVNLHHHSFLLSFQHLTVYIMLCEAFQTLTGESVAHYFKYIRHKHHFTLFKMLSSRASSQHRLLLELKSCLLGYCINIPSTNSCFHSTISQISFPSVGLLLS